jgi:hypothetical protein
MATQVRSVLRIEALQNALAFGPWDFHDSDNYDEMFAAQIQIGALTLAQIIGGVSPSILAIGVAQYLCIVPDQIIKIGLQGVNAQTSGFTLNAGRSFKSGLGSITSLNIYNTTTIITNVVVVIGGTP